MRRIWGYPPGNYPPETVFDKSGTMATANSSSSVLFLYEARKVAVPHLKPGVYHMIVCN